MNILLSVILIIAGIFILFLIVALFLKHEHRVDREIMIDAPQQKIFDYLRLLKNQEHFNTWAKTDENRKVDTRGTDGTVGYIYAWSGNKNAGEGEKEITNIIEGETIETEIRFIKPMQITSNMIMQTQSVTSNQTRVVFTNSGKLKYPLNIMIPFAQRNFAKDIDISLATLKGIMERDNNV